MKPVYILSIFVLCLAACGKGKTVLDSNKTTTELNNLLIVPTYNFIGSDTEKQIEAGGGWHIIPNNGGTGSASVENGVITVKIDNHGDIWYGVQLAYLPVKITEGNTYAVSFTVKADNPRPAVFEVGHVGGSWNSFSGRQELELTGEWETYEYTFTALGNDNRARFEINLGDSTETAYVKDVMIWEKEGRKK